MLLAVNNYDDYKVVDKKWFAFNERKWAIKVATACKKVFLALFYYSFNGRGENELNKIN